MASFGLLFFFFFFWPFHPLIVANEHIPPLILWLFPILFQQPHPDADDERPGHASFLLCCLSRGEEQRGPEQVAPPGSSSPLIGQTEAPFRHGSLPPRETATASCRSGPRGPRGKISQLPCCHPRPLDPATPDRQGGGGLPKCLWISVGGWFYVCVSVCERERARSGQRYDAVAMNLLSSREFLFYCASRTRLSAGKLWVLCTFSGWNMTRDCENVIGT